MLVRRHPVILPVGCACRILAGEAFAHAIQLLLVDQRLHGIGALVVPIRIKAARQILHQRPGDQHVYIDEVRLRVAKVRVAQIAPAHHPHHVIGQKKLVVHALLRTLKIRGRMPHAAERTLAISRQRIEHAHLHIRHERHVHHQRIAPRAMKVVQQNPHPHATPRRLCNGAHQPLRARIRMDRVILQIQRLPRVLHQRQAAPIRRLRPRQQHEPRSTRPRLVFLLLAALRQLRQRQGGRWHNGRGDRAVNVGGEFAGGAAGEKDHTCEQQRECMANLSVDGHMRRVRLCCIGPVMVQLCWPWTVRSAVVHILPESIDQRRRKPMLPARTAGSHLLRLSCSHEVFRHC
ncbi:hypothetical protein SDC9_95083 [bioreactor metagenome]|uniref:Uncharacterized protein n=1 Tax=bioreactor metagenome TaxID=1076179 RepID=A0A645A596_9ZZZZ